MAVPSIRAYSGGSIAEDAERNSHSTDERTFIASVLPWTAVGDSEFLLFSNHSLTPALVAILCSYAFDFAGRQKLGGANNSFYITQQLPVLPPIALEECPPWCPGSMGRWLAARVLELTYTAWDLEPFARDVGWDGPPFRWDPARRFLLRAELDAAFFHLYGISRDDTAYILDTFPIVRKNDQKAHGEYRTKRVILEVYDAMADATRTGTLYPTRLDPPPADPRVGHPDTREGKR
jgi:hypothetical protein